MGDYDAGNWWEGSSKDWEARTWKVAKKNEEMSEVREREMDDGKKIRRVGVLGVRGGKKEGWKETKVIAVKAKYKEINWNTRQAIQPFLLCPRRKRPVLSEAD